jgi:hypothetical protein
MIVTFTYETTMITPDLSRMSGSRLSKDVKCGFQVSKDAGGEARTRSE